MNYQELKNINNSINKLKSQIDALKYYLSMSKLKDKNTQYIKIVVADMDELMNFEMSRILKSIKQEENNLRNHKVEKEEKYERRSVQEPKEKSGLG